ncbi:Unhealthy ribosome biogenesis protein 2-like protein, partial [Stegodyphus mimosarum]
MNNLWINLKNICDCLNSMLTQEPLPTVKLKLAAFNITKLINCLPLEYLFPANQMRCIIGLSFLLFMIPDNYNIYEAMPQAEEICGFLSAIFDGVRSVWLFDFVNSGLYLQAVIKTLEKLVNKQKQMKDWTWMIQFFSCIINLSTRNVESLVSLEDCLSKLEINLENKVTILIICVLLQELAKIIQRAYLQDDYKRKIECIASVTCSHIVKCLKYDSSEVPDGQMYSLLINSYKETLEIMTSASFQFDENKKHECLELLPNIFENVLELLQGQVNDHKDVYLQFVSKICTHNKKLENYVPEDFKVLAWKTIFLYFKGKVELIKESSLKNSLQSVSTKNLHSYSTPKSSGNGLCKHVCPKYVCDSSTSPTLFAASDLIHFHLNESEKKVLKSLSTILTQEELNVIFQELMNEMDNYEIALLDVLYLQLKLEIVKSLIEVDYSQRFSSFSGSLQKCTSFLHCIVNEACDSTVCLCLVKFPVLEFLHFILKQDKVHLPRQCAIQFLHSCASIEINKQGRELKTYIRCFNSVWDIVYNLLVHYPDVVLTITADYLSFVTNLLKSLVLTGDQDNISTCSKDIQQDIHLCAQNMDRLLTVIARHKNEFCKLVPYIIADYVDSVQHVTLGSVIKSFLVSGINRLLDICNEDALKMLSVNINHSCREIFKNLVKNYKQYKYSG